MMLVGGNGWVCGGFEREENRYFISLPRRFANEDLGETNGPTCFSYCRSFLDYLYQHVSITQLQKSDLPYNLFKQSLGRDVLKSSA